MKARIVIVACLVGLLALAVTASAQIGGIQIPGLSKDVLLEQAKTIVSDLVAMKTSGKLPAAQVKKVDELLPKARSINTELAKPQVDAARLPQLASSLNDLQSQVSALKAFIK
jgi:hypothetical protein